MSRAEEPTARARTTASYSASHVRNPREAREWAQTVSERRIACSSRSQRTPAHQACQPPPSRTECIASAAALAVAAWRASSAACSFHTRTPRPSMEASVSVFLPWSRSCKHASRREEVFQIAKAWRTGRAMRSEARARAATKAETRGDWSSSCADFHAASAMVRMRRKRWASVETCVEGEGGRGGEGRRPRAVSPECTAEGCTARWRVHCAVEGALRGGGCVHALPRAQRGGARRGGVRTCKSSVLISSGSSQPSEPRSHARLTARRASWLAGRRPWKKAPTARSRSSMDSRQESPTAERCDARSMARIRRCRLCTNRRGWQTEVRQCRRRPGLIGAHQFSSALLSSPQFSPAPPRSLQFSSALLSSPQFSPAPPRSLQFSSALLSSPQFSPAPPDLFSSPQVSSALPRSPQPPTGWSVPPAARPIGGAT